MKTIPPRTPKKTVTLKGYALLVVIVLAFFYVFYRSSISNTKPVADSVYLSQKVYVPPYTIEYTMMHVQKRDKRIEVLTSERGGSLPESFSKDMFDCSGATVQNYGETTVVTEASSLYSPAYERPIIKASPDEFIADAACKAIGQSLDHARVQP